MKTLPYALAKPCLIFGLVSLVYASSGIAADLSMADKHFIENAAQAGKAEIAASELAKTKSKNPEVLKFANTMITDHKKAYSELSDLAKQKGIEIPTEPSLVQKGKAKLLESKDGKDFDEAYAEEIGVAAHEDAVKLFDETSKEADDADVKKLASKTLPTLQHHLAEARNLQRKVKK